MIIKKKHIIAVLIGVIFLVAVFVLCINEVKNVNTSNNSYIFTVVIDAGHGGIDNGVSGAMTGVKESELNLQVAKLLKEDFIGAGFKVVMTRNGMEGLYGATHASLKKTDMLNRKKVIDTAEPDLVISIHMNEYTLSSRRGAQCFFKGDDASSKKLAESVQQQLNSLNEGVRAYSALKGDYYVLNQAPCPSTLVECGFLSNPEDEALLITEEYRERLAYAIFKGAVSFLSGAR